MSSKPNDFRTLTYPTIKSFTNKFGDNFSDIINKKNLTFVLTGAETSLYTYYTMALYAFSYGMTDRRKAEFKIHLDVKNTTG